MKVFVFSAHPYEIPFLLKAAEGKHDLAFTEKKLSVRTATLATGFDTIALFTADDASAPVLQKLASLGVRNIALRSAGYDHVDLPAATKIGIQVANVPAYSPYAIAEHAAAILLALNRKIVESQVLLSLQDFRLDSLVGFDIHGKTIGIIGTGAIGTAFARIMKGFGAQLLGYDPVQSEDALAAGVRYVSFDDLLSKSDVISVHCPLNPQTRHMIAAPQIMKMKKNCIVINTARGGVVKTDDLLDAIENNLLGGACLDVYEKEKTLFFEDHRNDQLKDPLFTRLKANKKIMLTGHQAFLTCEALQGIAETTVKNIDYWEDGEESPNTLNAVVKAVAN